MRSRVGRDVAFRVAAAGIVMASACSTPAQPTAVSSISITGPTFFSAIGQVNQLTATAIFSNGTSSNVSDIATWQSSNPVVVSVSTTGLITARGFGAAEIAVTYQGTSANVSIAVIPPP
jgi:hypothetical protein